MLEVLAQEVAQRGGQRLAEDPPVTRGPAGVPPPGPFHPGFLAGGPAGLLRNGTGLSSSFLTDWR
jgi:hypothetical protein